jgi:hypothetical protein
MSQEEIKRPPWVSVPTSCRLTAASSDLHLVIWLIAVVLDTGLVSVHPLRGDVTEVSVRQALWLPTVLDLERTEGQVRAEKACLGTLVGVRVVA